MQNERGNGKSSRDDFDKMTAIFRNRFWKIAHICEYYCVNTVWISSNWAAGQIGLNNKDNDFQCLRSNPLQFVGLVRGVGHLFA